MMRKALYLLVLGALLAGCSSRPAAPTVTPPAPGATAASPAHTGAAPAESTPVQSTTDTPPAPATVEPDPCAPDGRTQPTVEVGGNFWPGKRAAAPGTCRFVVDTGPLQIFVQGLTAPSEAAARATVQITGAAEEWPADARRFAEGTWDITYHVQGGAVGQTVQVRFQPAPAAKPLIVTLVRTASPTIAVSIAGPDGTFAPLTSGASLPPGPKRLRFQATGGVKLDFLDKAFHTEDWSKFQPDHTTLLAHDLVEVTFDNPPPLTMVNLRATGNDDLGTPDQSAHFYIGDPPELLMQDPAGHRTRLGDAPPDIWSAVIRPDGRYAALLTLDPDHITGVAVWLVDLKTGAVTRTPFTYQDLTPPGFDSRGRLIAPLEHGAIGILIPETGAAKTLPSRANEWSSPSPDGRYIVGRIGPPPSRGGTGGWNGPPRADDLVIRDLATDTERSFPWNEYAAFGDGLRWLPDGRLLQMTVKSDQPPYGQPAADTTVRYFTVDLQTGQRTPYDTQTPPADDWHQTQPAARPDERILGKLPDGHTLLLHWANLPHARHWPYP